jgi:hypothetical protein
MPQPDESVNYKDSESKRQPRPFRVGPVDDDQARETAQKATQKLGKGREYLGAHAKPANIEKGFVSTPIPGVERK